ncbi:serpin family protein [Prevotella salivae]|uniref:Serpin family protein n=1 Tax=Segatella salivae TaxID=228604 RepID=A0AAW4NNQ0_9BACT|nr:serpin family protein [Segatella salivae]MBW4865642.1 serpin family protein [Segatella salivae]MBW4909786.1 serpin family protein [Segatella salivae]
MRKIKWYIIAFALLLTACKSASLQGEAKGKYGQVKLNDVERAEVDSMVNGVAFRLIHEMQKNHDNLLVSPLGLCYALNMLNAGADGATQRQINRFLGRKILADRLCRTMLLADAATKDRQVKTQSDKVTTLIVDNRVDVGRGIDLLPAFEERMKVCYFAAIEEGKEAQKIILSNTLRFDGVWKEAFDSSQTQVGLFTTAEGKQKKVPLMSGRFKLDYTETNDYQLVKIPYNGGFNLYVLLPKTGEKLESIVSKLNVTTWQRALKQMQMADVSLWFPRLSTAKKNDMISVLKNLGVRDAFDMQLANLSKMTLGQAYVSGVKQEVQIDFNEQRTEAEAKTTMEVAVLCATEEPKKKEIQRRFVRCDHPFLYIVTNRFGAICFIGEVQRF